MRTGLSKKQKTTSVFFDEASPIIEVCTYNTSLKRRLREYVEKYPAECRLVDDDENGCLTFEIRKGRFSFKLNAPIQRRAPEGSQQAGKEEYPEFAARQEVTIRRPCGKWFPAGGVLLEMQKMSLLCLRLPLKYAILNSDSANADSNSLFCDIIHYGVNFMAVSYKKLWKMLIDRDMKKKDLCAAAGISHASMAKLGKNENVTTDVLVKICTALQCDIGDIMELVPDTKK